MKTSVFFPLVCLISFALLDTRARADIPSRESVRQVTRVAGFYKVASSNDPVFPMGEGRDWFLDFAKGTTAGSTSGSVAVSLRENPNVRVRILVWEIFPDTGSLVIGNQFAEGARGAVALADWKIQRSGGGLRLQRGNYQVVLRESGADD